MIAIYKPKHVLDCAAMLASPMIMADEIQVHWVRVSILDTDQTLDEIMLDFSDRTKSPLSSLRAIREMEEKGVQMPTHFIGTADLIEHQGRYFTPSLQGLKTIKVVE